MEVEVICDTNLANPRNNRFNDLYFGSKCDLNECPILFYVLFKDVLHLWKKEEDILHKFKKSLSKYKFMGNVIYLLFLFT